MHQVELEGKYLHAQLSCNLSMFTGCCGQLWKGSHKAMLSTTLLPGGLWMCPLGSPGSPAAATEQSSRQGWGCGVPPAQRDALS